MKIYCVFSLESPQRGDSNKYTQYTISQYKKENHLKLSQIRNYGICSKGLKNEFETAMVNEPSVFKPLKFHCSFFFVKVYRQSRTVIWNSCEFETNPHLCNSLSSYSKQFWLILLFEAWCFRRTVLMG